ncbi:MAG: 2-oxoacid:acceptor oxidoreductase family protein [Nitrospirae bacterium]|nr:2-oxoacid:acceptor oxidoreductase family protein [Nitrospirota bacterium]
MEKKIIIAGSGGQGILFLGRMLMSAAMLEGRDVTWFPSYGAEMRGGTANCTVIIADEMIGSPVVITPDILIAMNRASLERFLPSLRKKGLLFYDSSLIPGKISRKDLVAIPVPATKIAGDMDNQKSANMVMLGAFIAKTALLNSKTIFSIFEDNADPKKAEAFSANRELVRKGMDCIENT